MLPVGDTTVTFTANDSSGNTGTATATLTVSPYVDSSPPLITAPVDITVEASEATGSPATDTEIADFLAAATATDDVDGTISSVSSNAPDFFPIGATEVTFTASDSAGNTGTANATVTVSEHVDNTAPSITPPADIFVMATTPGGTPATDTMITNFLSAAKAVDDLDGEIGIIAHDAPATFPVGATTVTFSASDRSGNASTATATVTVSEYVDTSAPLVTAPENISVAANTRKGTPATEEAIAAFLGGATAKDDVDGEIKAITHDAPRIFPIGETAVMFSATNAAGLVGTASATVTIKDYLDVTSPLLSPPTRLTVAAAGPTGTPASDPAITAFLAGATAKDDSDGEIGSVSHNAPDLFPVGDTRVTFSARDTAGNIGTVSAFVTVQPYADVTAPLVIPPGNLTVTATEPSGIPATDQAIADFLAAATALDDVDGDITAIANDAPSTFPAGTTTVTFTASDAAGNTGSATAIVQVEAYTPATEASPNQAPNHPADQPQEGPTPIERPQDEQPLPVEQPPAEQPPVKQPQSGSPMPEQTVAEQLPAEQPAIEQSQPEKLPTAKIPEEQPQAEQPHAMPAEQPIAEQPQSEPQPAAQPEAEQPLAEQPQSDALPTEQPPAEQSQDGAVTGEQPLAEQPAAEQPIVEQPSSEQPHVEQPPAEQPAEEQPRVERPPIKRPAANTSNEKLYLINFSSHLSKSEASTEQQRLARLNIQAEIKSVRIKNRTWYRLRSVARFEKRQARKELSNLKKNAGLTGSWLEKAEPNR